MRFGSALRADLQEVYGVDVASMFAEKRWVQLLALIDGLPAHSRYVQAMYEDEEWMELVNQGQDDPPQDTPPPLATWSPEVDMLAQIVDSLAVLTQTTLAVGGGKPKKVKPVKRPLTSSGLPDELNEAQEDILAQFTPDN